MGSNYPGIIFTYELSSALTYNYGWTYGASRTWVAIGITFPATGGAAAVPNQPVNINGGRININGGRINSK
jgi:hypothetical protein